MSLLSADVIVTSLKMPFSLLTMFSTIPYQIQTYYCNFWQATLKKIIRVIRAKNYENVLKFVTVMHSKP